MKAKLLKFKSKVSKNITITLVIFTMIIGVIIYSFANDEIKLDVSEKPNIDIVLTKGRSKVDLKNFEADMKEKLQEQGIDPERVKISAVDATTVESQESFDWQRDISTTIGNITITDSGKNVRMVGNTRNAGSNAIYIIPKNSSEQKFNFGYSINFGDSFNAGGMLLRVQQNGNTLQGYMLSFNNSSWKSAAGENNGALWKFTYNIGSHSNISKTLVKGLNINQSGTLNVNATDTLISISGGGLSQQVDIPLSELYGNGYGFFSDHYSHGCDQIGSFSLTNINLETQTIKDFREVLTAPEWRTEAVKALVNVTDESNEQFNSNDDLSDIISRLLNDDAHYIGWGTDENKSQMENLISINDNKGMFVNNTDYENAIEKTAEYIKTLISNPSKGPYVIAGEPVSITVNPESAASNTTDTEWTNGRWKVDQNYKFFENSDGQYDKSGIFTDSVISEFPKTGKYEISYENNAISNGIVYAHRRPVASFNATISDGKVTLTSTSYDLDKTDENNGISKEDWYYKKLNDSSWTYGKLENIDTADIYLVKLIVTDYQNTQSKETTMKIQGNGKSSTSKPIAAFTIKKNTISTYEDLDIVDTSYDPAGLQLSNKQWQVFNKNDLKTPVYEGKDIPSLANFSSKETGEYVVKLMVTNENNVVSDTFSQNFTLTGDVTAPEITVDPTNKKVVNQKLNINVNFTDTESGFKSYRYAFTESNIQAKDDNSVNWSDEITKDSDSINVEAYNKKVYLHIIATDNDGNESIERIVGPYEVERIYNVEIQTIKSENKTLLQGVNYNITCTNEKGESVNLGDYAPDEDGKILLSNLPINDKYKFRLEPTEAPGDYEKGDTKIFELDCTDWSMKSSDDNIQGSINFQMKDGDNTTCILQNVMKQKTFKLKLKNVDTKNDGMLLSGSKFTINYLGNEYGKNTVTTNGIAEIEVPVAGANVSDIYTIIQETAVDGYNKINDTKVNITFENGEVTKIVPTSIFTNIKQDDNDPTTIIVKNKIAGVANSLNIVATVRDSADEDTTIQGLTYKLDIRTDAVDQPSTFTSEEQKSDINGEIKYENLNVLYDSTKKANLIFTNTNSTDNYAQSDEQILSINIDQDNNDITVNNSTGDAEIFGRYDSKSNTLYVNLKNEEKKDKNFLRIEVVSKDDNNVKISGLKFNLFENSYHDGDILPEGSSAETDENGYLEFNIDSKEKINGSILYQIEPDDDTLNDKGIKQITSPMLIQIDYDDTTGFVTGANSIIPDASSNEVTTTFEKIDSDKEIKHEVTVTIKAEMKVKPGNKFTIKTIDAITGNEVSGNKYQVVVKPNAPAVLTTGGDDTTQIPYTGTSVVTIKEVSAANGYKLSDDEITIKFNSPTKGNRTTESCNKIDENQIEIDPNTGDVVVTLKSIQTIYPTIKFDIYTVDTYDNTNKLNATYQIQEGKTGYVYDAQLSDIDSTKKHIQYPEALIKDEDNYKFVISQVYNQSDYDKIPEDVTVAFTATTGSRSLLQLSNPTIETGDASVIDKDVRLDDSNNTWQVALTIGNKKNIPNNKLYNVNLIKEDSDGKEVYDAEYNIQFIPLQGTSHDRIVTVSKNDYEVKDETITEGKTLLILNEQKPEIGYSLDKSTKNVVLENVNGVLQKGVGTSDDIVVEIIKENDGKTTVKITIKINEDTKLDDGSNVFNVDIKKVNSKGENLFGARYNAVVANGEDEPKTISNIDILDDTNYEIKKEKITKGTTTIKLTQTENETGYIKEDKVIMLVNENGKLIKFDDGTSQDINVKIDYDQPDGSTLITVTITSAEGTDPSEVTIDPIAKVDIKIGVRNTSSNVVKAIANSNIKISEPTIGIDEQKTTDASGNITFDEHKVDKEGTYTFTISQIDTPSDYRKIDNEIKFELKFEKNSDGAIILKDGEKTPAIKAGAEYIINSDKYVVFKYDKHTNTVNVNIDIQNDIFTKFGINLYVKQSGKWDYTINKRKEIYNPTGYNWWVNEVYPTSLSGEQQLPTYFGVSNHVNFRSISGSNFKAETQEYILGESEPQKEIYETIEKSTSDNTYGNTDRIEFKNDYRNKTICLTITETTPGINYERIGTITLKIEFDEHVNVKQCEILNIGTAKKDDDFVVGGVSYNGKLNVSQLNYIYAPLSGSVPYYTNYNLNRFNSIGTNNIYVGLLNNYINNGTDSTPLTFKTGLTDIDSEEPIPDGSFNVIASEVEGTFNEKDGTFNETKDLGVKENIALRTDNDGLASQKFTNVYANRILKYTVTQNKPYPHKVGGVIQYDTIKKPEVYIFYIKYDDKGKIINRAFSDKKDKQFPKLDDNTTYAKLSNNTTEVNFETCNYAKSNFTINIKNLGLNGEKLDGFKFKVSTVKSNNSTDFTGVTVPNETKSRKTDTDGSTKLNIQLPESGQWSYQGANIVFTMDEIYATHNYKALQGLKLYVHFDSTGNLDSVVTMNGQEKYIQITKYDGMQIDITINNEKITEYPTFRITTADYHNKDVKLSNAKYSITSYDEEEYTKYSLTEATKEKDVETEATDEHGFTEIVMKNSFPLRTMIYIINEVQTPDSYKPHNNQDMLLKVQYDENGKFKSIEVVSNVKLFDNGRTENVIQKANNDYIGKNFVDLNIYNQLKPQFQLNIIKKDISGYNVNMANVQFKATSQVKKQDGTYDEADEEEISLETDATETTYIGFRNKHANETVLYTIYELKGDNSDKLVKRGQVEVEFDAYGVVKVGRLVPQSDADYLVASGTELNTNKKYITIHINVETFKIKTSLFTSASYAISGAKYTIKNSYDEKGQSTSGSDGLFWTICGEIYKNESIKYTFTEDKELNDYNKIEDFSYIVNFDTNGTIKNVNELNNDNGTYNILSYQKIATENMSVQINLVETERQEIQINLKNYDDENENVKNAKYIISEPEVGTGTTNLIIDPSLGQDKNGIADIGPNKGFNGTRTFLLKQVKPDGINEENLEFLRNANDIKVLVEYDENGKIAKMPTILDSDGFVEVDKSSVGTTRLVLNTLNKRKAIFEIENQNKEDSSELITTGNTFKVSTTIDGNSYSINGTTRDGKIEGNYKLHLGTYLANDYVTYTVEQTNQPDLFKKIPTLTFKIHYNKNGIADDLEIPNKDDENYLGITILKNSDLKDADFKLTIKNEPKITIGLNTVDKKTGRQIGGGQYIIENNTVSSGILYTQQSGITGHIGILSENKNSQNHFSIKEVKAPTGYKYKNKDNVIATFTADIDENGHIVKDTVKVTDGDLQIITPVDKSENYDMDFQMEYEETEEFKIIIETQDEKDPSTKISAEYNGRTDMNPSYSKAEVDNTTNLPYFNFGKMPINASRFVIINQGPNIQDGYELINAIGLDVKFDESGKISTVTAHSGYNGNAYTIDPSYTGTYTLRLIVKNSKKTRITLRSVNYGTETQVVESNYELTYNNTKFSVNGENPTGIAEITPVPNSKPVEFTIKQTSITTGYEKIRDIHFSATFDYDGGITSVQTVSNSNYYADPGTDYTINKEDDRNITIVVKNKEKFEFNVSAEDKFAKTSINGVYVKIEQVGVTPNVATTLQTGGNNATAQLGTNNAGRINTYYLTISGIPSGYVQQADYTQGYINRQIKIKFAADGSVDASELDNLNTSVSDLIKLEKSGNLGVKIKVQLQPLAKITVYRKDKANGNVITGETITFTGVNGTRITQNASKSYIANGATGKIEINDFAMIAPGTQEYMIRSSTNNKDYDALSGIPLNVMYSSDGYISHVSSKSTEVKITENYKNNNKTRDIEITIESERKFSLELYNQDSLQPSTALGGTFQIQSSKEKDPRIVTITNPGKPTIIPLGSRYSGETVSYKLHQTSKDDGYGAIPDIEFKVEFKVNGDFDITSNDTNGEYTSIVKRGQFPGVNQGNAIITLKSKAQLIVRVKAIDKLYNQEIEGLEFKVRDEKSGTEKTANTTTASDGTVNIPIDSVYSNETVNYTLIQTKDKGGYNIQDPIKFVVRYDSVGAISTSEVATYVVDNKGGKIDLSYTINQANLNKKAVQVNAELQSRIGFGIVKKDDSTGNPLENVQFEVTENVYKKSTNQVGKATYSITTDVNGEADLFTRNVDTDIKKIEYTFTEANTKYGYRKSEDFTYELSFDDNGRVISADTPNGEDLPANVTCTGAEAGLQKMDNKKEYVHVKAEITNDNKFTFRIKNTDANFPNIGIKGAEYNITITSIDGTIKTLNNVKTNSKGIIDVPIDYNDKVIIQYNQVIPTALGYKENRKNSSKVIVNKQENPYLITQDPNSKTTPNIDNEKGIVEVDLTNESELVFNIQDVDVNNTSQVVTGNTFSIKAQVGEDGDTNNSIISKTDNVVSYPDTYTNTNGNTKVELGDVSKFAGKKVIFTITEITSPNGVDKNEDVRFAITFDESGKIIRTEKISARLPVNPLKNTTNSFETTIIIKHGKMDNLWGLKVINESKYGKPINDVKMHVNVKVKKGTETITLTDADVTSHDETDINGNVTESGVYETEKFAEVGDVTVTIDMDPNIEGYKKITNRITKNITLVSGNNSMGNPIISGPTGTDTNTDGTIIAKWDSTLQQYVITFIYKPLLTVTLKSVDEEGNQVSGIKYEMSMKKYSDGSIYEKKGPSKMIDGELTEKLDRRYSNEKTILTVTQNETYGFENVNPINIKLSFDENGKIDQNPRIMTRQDNAKIEYSEYGITITIINKKDENTPTMNINIVAFKEGDSTTKLSDAVFQVKISPEVGEIRNGVVKTGENGIGEMKNIHGNGKIKIEVTEYYQPKDYEVSSEYKVATFYIDKDDTQRTMKKVSSSIDDSLWNVDQNHNLITISIPNKLQGVEIRVQHIDKDNEMNIVGTEYKLTNKDTGDELKAVTDKNGFAKFNIPKAKIKDTTVNYEIVETNITNGYKIDNKVRTLSVEYKNGLIKDMVQNGFDESDSDGIDSDKKTITLKILGESNVTNMEPYNIKIINEDEDNDDIKITGSVFHVDITQEKGSSFISKDTKTGKDGNVSLNDIKGEGKIEIDISEKQTIEGYQDNIYTGIVKMTRSSDDGQIYIDSTENVEATYNDDTKTVEIVIMNKKDPRYYSLVINIVGSNNELINGETVVEVEANGETKKFTSDNGKITVMGFKFPDTQNFEIAITEEQVPDGYTKNNTQILNVSLVDKGENKEIVDVTKSDNSTAINEIRPQKNNVELNLQLNNLNGDLYLRTKLYVIDNDYVDSISAKTTVKDFIANMESNGTISVVDKNGNTVTDETKLVGTGMKVVATKDGDKKENTIIVTGDNTGDGKLNTADILKLKRAVAKMIELNEIEKRASDVRNDGQINQKDILKMSRLVAGIPDK